MLVLKLCSSLKILRESSTLILGSVIQSIQPTLRMRLERLLCQLTLIWSLSLTVTGITLAAQYLSKRLLLRSARLQHLESFALGSKRARISLSLRSLAAIKVAQLIWVGLKLLRSVPTTVQAAAQTTMESQSTLAKQLVGLSVSLMVSLFITLVIPVCLVIWESLTTCTNRHTCAFQLVAFTRWALRKQLTPSRTF